MKLRFTSPTQHPPGTVFALLKRAWDPLWNAKLEQKIRQFDSQVTEHQGKGIGKAQIQEIIRVLRNQGIGTACVTTTDEDFFIPAQRTYEACGLVRVCKTQDNNIEYQLPLI